MSVLAVGSVRSCGVSTLATGLAMLWPRAGSRLLVEADPAGGVLAAAAGLGPEPGLVSLAAAARRQGDPDMVFEHCQALVDGTAVLCGPPGADRAGSALGMAAGLLGRLGELDADVLLDCGRLDPASPVVELFDRADLKILATRPRLADLHALAAFFESHDRAPGREVLVLVGPGPYPPDEIAEALGTSVAGQVPWDPEAAEAIPGTPVGSRRLTRTPLVRALRSLAAELAEWVEPGANPPLEALAQAGAAAQAVEVTR
jgi:MinD-like ATPase involved in chromosome partitioning or flagellar assembly